MWYIVLYQNMSKYDNWPTGNSSWGVIKSIDIYMNYNFLAFIPFYYIKDQLQRPHACLPGTERTMNINFEFWIISILFLTRFLHQ